MSIFDALAAPVAFVLKQIHAGLSTFLPDGSGWAWGLSIVLLTITVRIVLFPLFVKQIKSQRRMQELAPKVKALQAKHKGDRETLNTELMKLYKDHGTNPVSGCLPLVFQLPVFFALFRVMNEFRPRNGHFTPKYGLSSHLIEQAAHAKVFGAPISAAFNSTPSFLKTLDGSASTVKIVAALMIVTMGGTTFFTQRQMMARNGAPADPQQAQVQKVMLYILPLSFALFGFSFPIGVLLYWLTTNVWSMGQQHFVIKRMPPVQAGATAGTAGKAKAGTEREPRRGKGSTPALTAEFTDEPAATSTATATPSDAATGQTRPAGNRAAAGTRKNKKRKGGRR